MHGDHVWYRDLRKNPVTPRDAVRLANEEPYRWGSALAAEFITTAHRAMAECSDKDAVFRLMVTKLEERHEIDRRALCEALIGAAMRIAEEDHR